MVQPVNSEARRRRTSGVLPITSTIEECIKSFLLVWLGVKSRANPK
jgi:hypothetical protein